MTETEVVQKRKRKKKTALCMGITDECCDEATGKLIGYVGFHEYDGYIEIMELRNRVKEVARELGIDVFCLKTGKGYHFVSFTIMQKGEREEFAKIMQTFFPSNYLQHNKHRVLRLSKKGAYMKPEYLFDYHRLPETKVQRLLSSSHMEVYVNEGIIQKEAIEELLKYNGGNVLRTSLTNCAYPAWIPENMKAASLKKRPEGKNVLRKQNKKKDCVHPFCTRKEAENK